MNILFSLFMKLQERWENSMPINYINDAWNLGENVEMSTAMLFMCAHTIIYVLICILYLCVFKCIYLYKRAVQMF